MEALISTQRDLHRRIARSYENLRKVRAAKLSVALVQPAMTNLESKWNKFEAQHEHLQLTFAKGLAETDYITSDYVSTVELAYLEQ
ncbi:hypothetical protein RF55_24017 [Lasius niger]|uniref:Uncharacterized protein n=1 Tax=Lasius niger TaxID=67767 RepID=A0A0J7JV97_LASNI|nr:hypothetical protein RF55_24017 [Lasius niger]